MAFHRILSDFCTFFFKVDGGLISFLFCYDSFPGSSVNDQITPRSMMVASLSLTDQLGGQS